MAYQHVMELAFKDIMQAFFPQDALDEEGRVKPPEDATKEKQT